MGFLPTASWTKPIRVHADNAGTRYYFWLRSGSRDPAPPSDFWRARYNFGDILSEHGGATLLAAFVDAFCFRVSNPLDGSSTLFVIETDAGGLLQINGPPPHYTDNPVPQEQTVTYELWCLFRNWYDSNWRYRYSEEIPGSCFYIQKT
jgi:hypothetical protein